MVSKNDITGDAIQTKVNSKAYRDNWESIFGKKAPINSTSLNNEDVLDGDKEETQTEREANP